MPDRAHVPVREPEISELRAFCAAAALGSIAEAARAMSISQPAMSKRLRVLETVTGTELLVRSTRGVTLTPAGEQLYTAAQRLLVSADTLNKLFQIPTAVKTLRIASSPTAAELRLPAALSELAGGIELLAAEVTTANSWVVRELVREGGYDLGIVATDVHVPRADDLRERRLWDDEIVVAVPSDHEWLQYDEIPLDEFLQTPLLERDPYAHSSRLVSVVLELGDHQRAEPVAQLGNTAALLHAAGALGVPALLSRESIERTLGFALAVRRVQGVRFLREFTLVWSGPIMGLPASAQTVAKHLMDVPFPDARAGAWE